MELTFQEVVKEYRRSKDLSVRGFAEYLTEGISNTSLSGQTISRWETEKISAPDLYLLLNIFTTYTDDRMYFAIAALKAVLPHVFDSGLLTFHIPTTK